MNENSDFIQKVALKALRNWSCIQIIRIISQKVTNKSLDEINEWLRIINYIDSGEVIVANEEFLSKIKAILEESKRFDPKGYEDFLMRWRLGE